MNVNLLGFWIIIWNIYFDSWYYIIRTLISCSALYGWVSKAFLSLWRSFAAPFTLSKMHSFNCVQQRLKLPINSYNRNASDLQLLNSCNYKEKLLKSLYFIKFVLTNDKRYVSFFSLNSDVDWILQTWITISLDSLWFNLEQCVWGDWWNSFYNLILRKLVFKWKLKVAYIYFLLVFILSTTNRLMIRAN